MIIHRKLLGIVVGLCLGIACSTPPQVGSCTTADDCTGDQICMGGKCKDPECTKSSDCSSGEICYENQCVTDTRCKSSCNNGDIRCAGDGYQLCQPQMNGWQATGCFIWGEIIPCGDGKSCKNGQCEGSTSCSNECTENQKRCSGTQIQLCRKLSSGCTAWGAPENCPATQECQNGVCAASCQNNCSTSGASECVSNASYHVCSYNAKGCLVWEAPQSCSGGQTCKNGSCATVQAQEGQSCQVNADCVTGLLCLPKTGTTGPKVCQRYCTKSSDCPAGSRCYALKTGSKACGNLAVPPVDATCKVIINKAIIVGGCWDVACGAPDPYVLITIPGRQSVNSSVFQDNFAPVWNEETRERYQYSEILQMTVTMMDEDVEAHDTMVTWTPDGGRWNMSSPTSQVFKLETQNNMVTLYIFVVCSAT